MSNCTFESNGGNPGGAIWYSPSGNTVLPSFINNCTFSNNISSGIGGALYLVYSQNSANLLKIISNTLFESNVACKGGAIGNFQDPINQKIFNCTFYNNSATCQGGAIYNGNDIVLTAFGFVDIYNSIFWNNTAPGLDNHFYSQQVALSLTNSIVQAADCSALDVGDGSQTISCNGVMLYNQNPNFSNEADPDGLDDIFLTTDDGLSLSSNSPAINSGTTDIDYIEDILHQNHINTPDIGAYEYPCSDINTISSLPDYVNQTISNAAVLTLTASNVISPSSNVYYQAGQSIFFNAGFEVKEGNIFEAAIDDGCP